MPWHEWVFIALTIIFFGFFRAAMALQEKTYNMGRDEACMDCANCGGHEDHV